MHASIEIKLSLTYFDLWFAKESVMSSHGYDESIVNTDVCGMFVEGMKYAATDNVNISQSTMLSVNHFREIFAWL